MREKYLKPDGHMFPSHATMFWAAVNDEAERELREKEYHDVSFVCQPDGRLIEWGESERKRAGGDPGICVYV